MRTCEKVAVERVSVSMLAGSVVAVISLPEAEASTLRDCCRGWTAQEDDSALRR